TCSAWTSYKLVPTVLGSGKLETCRHILASTQPPQVASPGSKATLRRRFRKVAGQPWSPRYSPTVRHLLMPPGQRQPFVGVGDLLMRSGKPPPPGRRSGRHWPSGTAASVRHPIIQGGRGHRSGPPRVAGQRTAPAARG